MKTITSLTPMISQSYNALLLSFPSPKLRDSCETILKMLEEIEKMWHKLDSNPIKKERCQNLKLEIIELYERAKVKEKERETEKDHKTQGFGYFIDKPEKIDRNVYWRLRFRRKTG